MALTATAISGTGQAFGTGGTNAWKRYDITTTDASTLQVASDNQVRVSWSANASSVTLAVQSGSTFATVTSTKGYHFRYNNVNYLFLGSDITGTGGSRTVALSALDKALDTSTASSGTITVHETDTLDDLMTAIQNAPGISITRTNDVDRYNRVITMTNTATTGDNLRTLIACRARIVDERSGYTEIRMDWSGTGGGLFINLCGGSGAKVTIGREINNILVGRVRFSIVGSFNNNGFGAGNIQPSDRGYTDNGVLRADSDSTYGYAKYFMPIGLAGSDDWFYTPDVPNTHAYEFVVEMGTVNKRFDIDTADEGHTGVVSFNAWGVKDGDGTNDNGNVGAADSRFHITAGSWDPVTGLAGSSQLMESKYKNRTIGANEITGVGGGTQNSWQLSRTYPTSYVVDEDAQRVDFQCFNINSLRSNTSLVLYDFPFRRYRALRFGYQGSGSGSNAFSTHSIILTPGGTKPYGNFIDITRDDHGFHGRGANFITSLGITPTYQDTSGNKHEKAWMLYDRTYRNAADSADVAWTITGLETSATSLTNTDGRLDPHGSSNPDLVHIDSADSGSSKSSTVYGYYMWEIDGTDNGDKRGGILPYIYTSCTGSSNGGTINNNKYTGTYNVYFGAPGRATTVRTWQPMGSDDKMVTGTNGVEQDITINHNLFDHLSLDNSGDLEDVQVIELAGESVSNEVIQVSANHETYTLTGAINATQLLATVSSIPFTVASTWSGFTRAQKLETGNTGRYARYKGSATGHFARISEYDGDYILSASASKMILKSKTGAANRLIISTGSNIPTQVASEYTTIDISDGEASATRGEWQLGSNGLDCGSTGNHAYLQGRITGIRTYSSYALATASGAFSINAHTALNGTLEVAAASDVYVNFTGDCALESGSTFTVTRASGSGTVYLINAPSGGNYTDSNVSQITTIDITTPALSTSAYSALTANITSSSTSIAVTNASDFPSASAAIPVTAYVGGDEFTYTGKSGNSLTGVTGLSGNHSTGDVVHTTIGRMSLYASATGSEIVSLSDASTSNVSVNATTGEITYSLNSVDYSGLTAGTRVLVWSGVGGNDVRQSVTITTGSNADHSFNRSTSSEAAYADISSTATATLTNTAASGGNPARLTVTINDSGSATFSLSTNNTWYFIDNYVKATTQYNTLIAAASGNENSITNNGSYSQIDDDIIILSPGSGTAVSLGYVNDVDNQSQAATVTNANSSTITVAQDAPGVTPAQIAAGMSSIGVALQADVETAITGARNVLIGVVNANS